MWKDSPSPAYNFQNRVFASQSIHCPIFITLQLSHLPRYNEWFWIHIKNCQKIYLHLTRSIRSQIEQIFIWGYLFIYYDVRLKFDFIFLFNKVKKLPFSKKSLSLSSQCIIIITVMITNNMNIYSTNGNYKLEKRTYYTFYVKHIVK